MGYRKYHESGTRESGSVFTAEIPKITVEPKAVEKLLCFGLPRAPPIVVQAAGVPALGEFPTCLHRHYVPDIQIAPGKPSVKMILRTEGQNRRSCEADVFPEPYRGNHEMNDPIGIHRLPVVNGQIGFLAARSAPARGVPHGIFAEYGGDAEDVPHSVAPIPPVFDMRRVVCGQAREGVGHPD